MLMYTEEHGAASLAICSKFVDGQTESQLMLKSLHWVDEFQHP